MATQNVRYINPLTDFGFKKVFGNEDILCDFLNDIIEPKAPIVSLTFLDKEMKPQTKFEHGVVYDMRCRLNTFGDYEYHSTIPGREANLP